MDLQKVNTYKHASQQMCGLLYYSVYQAYQGEGNFSTSHTYSWD